MTNLFNAKQLTELKREVKAQTNLNLKDITIETVSTDYITYSHFESNYDRVVKNKTESRIEREV